MTNVDGIRYAYLLDAKGGGRALNRAELQAWTPKDGPLWVYLKRNDDTTRTILEQDLDLDAVTVEALLAEETRPRAVLHGKGALVNLRGVNMNPSADPEDMVSVRIWVENDRIVTVRQRKLMATTDMADAIELNKGPKTAGGALAYLSERLVYRMWPVNEELDDELNVLEEQLIEEAQPNIRKNLGIVRRRAIALRRFLSPQREAMIALQTPEAKFLTDLHRVQLRENTDRLQRIIEDLDEVRERAAVIQDELVNAISERMNKTMYLLTVVAAVMLPLGFLTGLLGINVGGMPGADNEWAFWIVTAASGVLMVTEILLLKHLKWI